jgi:hypothetical protein
MEYIFRLDSVIADGVAGPDAGAFVLIYSALLQKKEMAVYSEISINQIGDDLNEFISKKSKEIHINFRYPATPGFGEKSVFEQNRIRLETVHAALCRIAIEDKKLDIGKLEEIKEEILANDFNFEFKLFKEVFCNKNKQLSAQMIVNPLTSTFNYYVQIAEGGIVKCKVPIYCGGTHLFYFPRLFYKMKWKNENELIIKGKEPHVETHVFADTCKAEFINLTKYKKSPYFEMKRRDISKEEHEKAHEDWLDSMPPGIAAHLREDAIKTDEYKKSRGIL